MAYESLYRRYRPGRFSEVRGQDDVVRALLHAVREDQVGHAYLFSGPRGTGKTSTARILAKALNCTNLDNGEPCCACESCVAIESGTSYDLQELDAASNNGVDAMRDLIGKAALGSPGRTKVYILDEVHMLSAGASNALLKTLEEPPGHVVFVLATTDPHKVLPTIRSRTQHFELHLLPAEELSQLVRFVVADAELDVDEEGIGYALAAGGGSARDTLSALDQVVAAGGVLDRGDQVDDLVNAVADGDTGAALQAVADAVRRGHDPRVVGEALLARIRDVFLCRMGDTLGHLPEAVQTQINDWSERFTDRSCTRALELLGDALRDMRQAPDARIPLEVALVRLTRVDTEASIESLITRIERLEQRPPEPAVARTDDTASSRTVSTQPHPPSRPVSNPAGGGRPLDAARALLADKSAKSPPASETPATPSSRTPPPQVPPPRVEPTAAASAAPQAPQRPTEPPSPTESSHETPASADQPDTGQAPPTSSSPTATSSSTSGSDSAATTPGRDELTQAWADVVLPKLHGLTKAMFSVGYFVDASAGTAVFALPNAVHRDKCEQKRPEVESALTAHFGRPVSLELIVGDDAGASNEAARGGSTPRSNHERQSNDDGRSRVHSGGDETHRSLPSDPVDEDIGDPADLVDAPADDRTTIERVIEAFPGAEIIEP